MRPWHHFCTTPKGVANFATCCIIVVVPKVSWHFWCKTHLTKRYYTDAGSRIRNIVKPVSLSPEVDPSKLWFLQLSLYQIFRRRTRQEDSNQNSQIWARNKVSYMSCMMNDTYIDCVPLVSATEFPSVTIALKLFFSNSLILLKNKL